MDLTPSDDLDGEEEEGKNEGGTLRCWDEALIRQMNESGRRGQRPMIPHYVSLCCGLSASSLTKKNKGTKAADFVFKENMSAGN